MNAKRKPSLLFAGTPKAAAAWIPSFDGAERLERSDIRSWAKKNSTHVWDALRDATPSDRIREVAGTASAGEHITEACRRLADAAEFLGAEEASVLFNGEVGRVRVTAGNPAATAEALAMDWHDEIGRKSAERAASPEGAAEAELRDKASSLHERRGRELSNEALAALASIGPGRPGLACRALAPLVEHDGPARNLPAIADALEAAGYLCNDGVGDPAAKDRSDTALFARYCLGQFIDMVRCSGGIHPMLAEWMKQPDVLAVAQAEEEFEAIDGTLPSRIRRGPRRA